MSLYKQFKSDENLEKSGILLEYGFNSAGLPITIRIARAGGGNTAYSKRMEHKVKPYRRQIQTETIDTQVVEKLLREVYAETVVLGWENVEDGDGNPMAHSVSNCIKLFEDLPDLFKDIQEQSQRSALFRADLLDSAEGN
jgi:hypothetical protein